MDIFRQSELLASLKTWLGWMEARGQPGANAEVILKILLPILVDTDKIPAKISLAASALLLELSKRPNNLCPLKHTEIAVFIQEVTCYNLPLLVV